MGAQRRAGQDDGVLPPVDVIESIEKLQPGDIALVYLGGPGPAPAEHPPVGVIDLVDDIAELQSGDTALIYLPGAGLVAGTVDSITPPDRKRTAHTVAFTAPVTEDPASAQLTVTSHVLHENAAGTGVLVHAYRVNTARALRRAQLAARHLTSEKTPPDGPPQNRAVPEAAIVSGVIGSVARWGLTNPGHLINYTRPAFADGSYQFPINLDSAQAFISGYRVRAA